MTERSFVLQSPLVEPGATTDASINFLLALGIGVLLCGCGRSVAPTVPQGPTSSAANAGGVTAVEHKQAIPVTAVETATTLDTEACEELAHRCYRPVTFAELAARKAPPGRVVLTAVPVRHVGCKPCPAGHRCQPCGETVVFTEGTRPTAEAPYLALFSGSLPKTSHRLFLCLDDTYWQHVNGHPTDPRASAIRLEGAVVVSELAQHSEYRRSEMPRGQRESCKEMARPSRLATEKTP